MLVGLLAGLVARGAGLPTAALWAVAAHARIGQRLAQRIGAVGFLACEILAEIPRMLEDLTTPRTARRPAR